MSKIFNSFKNIRWMFLLKRFGGFALNYFILVLPVAILTIYLYVEIHPYMMFKEQNADGLSTIWIGITAIFPVEFITYLFGAKIYPSLLKDTLFRFLVIFASYFSLNTFTSLFVCNDIGSLPFGLIIVDKHGNRASRWRIVLRTFLKYLTVFLCPILLLFPLFNRRNACLHELISGAYKVEKPKPVYPPMYYPPQQQ